MRKTPRSIYIEELISFIDQLVPAETLKVMDSWDLISEEAANAVAEVLLQVGGGKKCRRGKNMPDGKIWMLNQK